MEDKFEWLLKCREQGHLNEWDIADAIDEARDWYQLKELLKFLIVEGMIKIWEPEDQQQ